MALAGTVIPFVAAQAILVHLYPPGVFGVPIPLWLSLLSYTLALLIALASAYGCYFLLKKDREPTDKSDGLDERENLPY